MNLDPVGAFARARDEVLGRIAAAATRAGRDPETVTLVGVSKTQPPEMVQAAIDAGVTVLGENRVQEAVVKVTGTHGGTWHLIGPLQANKARRALETVDVIQSVDSLDLARRLDRIVAENLAGTAFPVLLQVNVGDDPAKAGFAPAAVDAVLDELLDLEHLRVDGLMTIGTLVADPESARPTFGALRDLATRLRARDTRLGPELSMGMTADYEVAVEEGATIVRVGRALFGERPPPRA